MGIAVTTTPTKSIVIQSITEDGRQFRPSDWAERMCGMMSTFDGHRIQYSPLMRPISMDGVKCLAIDPSLATRNPAPYEQVMNFAKINKLKIVEIQLDNEFAPAA